MHDTLSGKKIDLGALDEGAQPVRLVIGPLADPAVTDVRMVRSGRTLRY